MAKKKPRSPKKPAQVRFQDMDLSDAMETALERAGYESPTPIQGGLIPLALDGADVMGQARTGTGKTAAFAIPIIDQLTGRRKAGQPQALIMVPTRELAVQVREEVAKLAHGRKFSCVAVYGGKPIRGQIEKLNRGVDIVVGTPGRLLDHIARGTMKLEQVRFAVLDEADRMLDIGFRPDIERILRRCPTDRQTLLLSATVPPPIERLAGRYMRDPVKLDFSPKELSVETIEQFYFTVDGRNKLELLIRVLEREKPTQAIIFCRTKRGTERVHRRLEKRIKSVACIHGDMQQSSRDRVMGQFRSGKIRHLVATDVVGRGIDVSGISHIINYDIPQFCDDYVHRVGRTGRMGREGVAYTFVAPEEGNELTRIEQRINRLLKRDDIADFDLEPLPSEESAPQAAEPAPEPPPPPTNAMRRPPKRYRRAL